MPEHNNILIVMADQLTAKALGCYGNQEVKSPNIDKPILFKFWHFTHKHGALNFFFRRLKILGC
jgi:arylsulfatase A-like enzyme